jgi:benzoyl-CoA reductase/2-hydroxyglutaryl-CoA dehydratase subunit BcrC/BadD/HgdB
MMASFLGGFGIEDWFINQSEAGGMAPTLCSYHKCFIGAVDSGLMPPAAAAVTTSTVCDGNVQTFRRAAAACRVPLTILDIPNEISPMAIAYVVEQLRHFIAELEDLCHRPFDRAALQAALDRENRSFAAYHRFLAAQRGRYYPSTLTIQMFNLFASHLAIGTPEILHFYEALERDVVSRPAFDGKTIFWIHLLPFYQETLKGYFNLSRDYQIQACDMNLDYNRPLNPARPLESLAKKMLGNIFVGPIERRIAAEKALITKTGADGVIEFCHWGCKQMAGGAGLMKEAFKAEGIPTLVIDGDGIDRRNSHDGQIKTRLEAFFEML